MGDMKQRKERTERLKAELSIQKTQHEALADDGRRRVVIAQVQPEIDAGRFPIKRVVGSPSSWKPIFLSTVTT